jgi:hypothetical protein
LLGVALLRPIANVVKILTDKALFGGAPSRRMQIQEAVQVGSRKTSCAMLLLLTTRVGSRKTSCAILLLLATQVGSRKTSCAILPLLATQVGSRKTSCAILLLLATQVGSRKTSCAILPINAEEHRIDKGGRIDEKELRIDNRW